MNLIVSSSEQNGQYTTRATIGGHEAYGQARTMLQSQRNALGNLLNIMGANKIFCVGDWQNIKSQNRRKTQKRWGHYSRSLAEL